MEPFFDGGVFEILIAIGIAYALNFIFFKKYLLIIYSLTTVATPILLLFIHSGELYYFLFAFGLFNAILLIVLLWKQRRKDSNSPLFEIDKSPIKKLTRRITFKKKDKSPETSLTHEP